MIWKASLVLSLVLWVRSDKLSEISQQKKEELNSYHGYYSHIGQHNPKHHEIYAWAYPSYEFSYYVNDPHTHDIKGQHEVRDEDKVRGNYWLLQPDGRQRTVKYSSDHKNGFQTEVYYQPHDGHHYEVRKHHEHKDHHRWEHERRRIGEGKSYQSPGENDKKGRVEIYREQDGDYEKRYDGRGSKQDHDNRRDQDNKRVYDDKHNHDVKRGYSDIINQDDKREDKDHLWRWVKQRKELRDNMHERRPGYGHEEHWKHGVLVGWTEGIDKDYRHRDDYQRDQEHNSDRDDRHKDRLYHRSDDKQRNDRHEDHRPPITIYKPLIPYGQRLD